MLIIHTKQDHLSVLFPIIVEDILEELVQNIGFGVF